MWKDILKADKKAVEDMIKEAGLEFNAGAKVPINEGDNVKRWRLYTDDKLYEYGFYDNFSVLLISEDFTRMDTGSSIAGVTDLHLNWLQSYLNYHNRMAKKFQAKRMKDFPKTSDTSKPYGKGD